MTTTAATLRSRRTVPRAVLVRRATALATGLAVVLGGWWLAAKAYGIPQLFPTPADTFRELSRSASDGSLFSATGASLRRIFIGLAIGSAAGVLLGLAAGASRFVWWFAEPFVNFFRFIPPLAWFAPVLLWFGAGETSKLVLIFYTTVFVVALNTMAGVRAVPRNKIRMAQSVGARRCHIFFLVMLPASMPYVLSGMRIAMGNAFMTVVAAEMLGAPTGLGVNITNAMTVLNVRAVFASLVVLGILGLATDRAFVYLIKRYGNRFSASPAK